METVVDTTDEQRRTLAELSMFYHEQVERILGIKVDICHVLHPSHGEGACHGILVLSALQGEEIDHLLGPALEKIQAQMKSNKMDEAATHDSPEVTQ